VSYLPLINVPNALFLKKSFNRMTEKLKQVLKHLVDFNERELETIVRCFKPKTVKRKTPLLSQTEVCTEFYYVNSGCIRTGFMTKEGNEKTRYVMHENYIGTALTSFISQKPSFEFIDALEDTELLAISHSDFYRLNDELTSWKIFYQRILEMAYSFQNKKIEGLVTLSARQRYEQLLKEDAILTQKLSNSVLASYLDMSQETLSRLKSR
jgi:CRP-like cAMP-binding protein